MLNEQTWELKSATESDNIQYCRAEQLATQYVSETLGAENVKCRPDTQNDCTKTNLEVMNNDCSHF